MEGAGSEQTARERRRTGRWTEVRGQGQGQGTVSSRLGFGKAERREGSGLIKTGPRARKGRKEGGRGRGERDKETSGEHVHVGSPPFPKRLPVTPLLAGSGRRASPPPRALRCRLGREAAVRGIWGRHGCGVAASRGGRPG